MTKEKLDKINKIVWYIPFRRMRDIVRYKMIDRTIRKEKDGNTKENKKWINECIEKYNALNKSGRFPIEAENNWYIFGENTSTIPFDAHYLYHPA